MENLTRDEIRNMELQGEAGLWIHRHRLAGESYLQAEARLLADRATPAIYRHALAGSVRMLPPEILDALR